VSQPIGILRLGKEIVGVDRWLVTVGVAWSLMEMRLVSALLVAFERTGCHVTAAVFLAVEEWLSTRHHGEDDGPNRKEFIRDGIRVVIL
jgi:hypothetical protein